MLIPHQQAKQLQAPPIRQRQSIIQILLIYLLHHISNINMFLTIAIAIAIESASHYQSLPALNKP
jgi:hypothetical protein